MKNIQQVCQLSNISYFFQKIRFFLLFYDLKSVNENQIKINQELQYLKLARLKLQNSLTQKLIRISIFKKYNLMIKGSVSLIKMCNQKKHMYIYNFKKLKSINHNLFLAGIRLNTRIYSMYQVKNITFVTYDFNVKRLWQVLIEKTVNYYKIFYNK